MVIWAGPEKIIAFITKSQARDQFPSLGISHGVHVWGCVYMEGAYMEGSLYLTISRSPKVAKFLVRQLNGKRK